MKLAIAAAALLSALPASAGTVRVATWNVQTVGSPATVEYNAALAVLQRIDADVVSIQEIDGSGDAPNFDALASAAGYPYTARAPGGPFGNLGNGVMSRVPIVDTQFLDGATLSGDPTAMDVTRDFVRVTVRSGSNELTVISAHLKSGSSDTDEFRRAVEAERIVDAFADLNPAVDAIAVMGDFNEEILDTLFPAVFTALPTGLPVSYDLGNDLAALLPSPGIDNDPFGIMLGAGLVELYATQMDGSWATRPASGRRLDYLLVSAPVLWDGFPDTEVYDSSDEGMAGLPKSGAPLSASTSLDASDHLVVYMDVEVPGGGSTGGPRPPVPGDLELTEFMANPSVCSDSSGEWVEVYNTSADTLDLAGMVLEDAGGTQGAVGSGTTVAPHSFAVLGKGDAASWCGAFVPDGYYGSVALNNDGDSLRLLFGLTELLSTPMYPAWAATSGASTQRDLVLTSQWCVSSTPLSGGEYGTPGAAQPGC